MQIVTPSAYLQFQLILVNTIGGRVQLLQLDLVRDGWKKKFIDHSIKCRSIQYLPELVDLLVYCSRQT
jgi:hypothetical protein